MIKLNIVQMNNISVLIPRNVHILSSLWSMVFP